MGSCQGMVIPARFQPVRVILPDNAWELGYTSFFAGTNYQFVHLQDVQVQKADRNSDTKQYLPPNAKVTYSLHAEVFNGEWQNGLRMMFRDRYLYDLEKFDNSLYEREDLDMD